MITQSKGWLYLRFVLGLGIIFITARGVEAETWFWSVGAVTALVLAYAHTTRFTWEKEDR